MTAWRLLLPPPSIPPRKGEGSAIFIAQARNLLLARGSIASLPLAGRDFAAGRPQGDRSLRWSDLRQEGHESYARMAGWG